MQQNNRGQAALEFLLTYSWAILVVIVIIGALAYFGVLNPENFIPEKCQLGAGLTCQDYAYDGTANEFQFRIVNGLGRTVNITNLSVFGADLLGTANDASDACGNSSGVIIPNGDYADILVTGADCAPRAGGSTSLRAEIQIAYRFADGLNTDKYNLGEIFVKNVQ